MNKLKFTLSNNTDNELKKVAILLTKVFKKKFKFNYIKWLYTQNPEGKAISCNIYYKNKIVGHYAIIPTKIIINKKIYKSALSLNTAVDDDFKGKGFFKIMANKTYRQAVRKGIRFIYGVSNNQSTKLFEKYFKFKNLGPLEVKIGFGQKINTPEKKIKINWNTNNFNWRLNNPKNNYKISFSRNKISIYYQILKIINISIGEFKNKSLIKDKKLNINLYNFFNLYIGIGGEFNRSSFYFNLPKLFKPSPLNFIIKDFSKKSFIKIFKRKDLLFQLIDFDAY